MRYPDTLKLYFICPERKITPARLDQLKSILSNFDGIVITHSHRYGSGIEYNLQEISRWSTGEIILNLQRKNEKDAPYNKKMNKYSKSWRDFKPSKKIKVINKLFKKNRQTRIDDYLLTKV